MIKLIASDIDGTLLQNGETAIRQELFCQMRRLKEQGVSFCAASGRQYSSLRTLFAPVADSIFFVCENGAVVYHNEQVLAKTPMPQAEAMELIGQILARKNCEVLISGANTSYLLPKQQDYLDHIRNFMGNNIQIVKSLDEIPEEVVKVSAYCAEGALYYEASLGGPWKSRFEVAVAGEKWLDFTLADKGTGLAAVCGRLGIEANQVMAFGDNFNDLPMLRFAGRPYVIKGALVESSAAFCAKTDRVETVLARL